MGREKRMDEFRDPFFQIMVVDGEVDPVVPFVSGNISDIGHVHERHIGHIMDGIARLLEQVFVYPVVQVAVVEMEVEAFTVASCILPVKFLDGGVHPLYEYLHIFRMEIGQEVFGPFLDDHLRVEAIQGQDAGAHVDVFVVDIVQYQQ